MQKHLIATASAAALFIALGLTATSAQAPVGGPDGAAPSTPSAQQSSPVGGGSPGMNQRSEDGGGPGKADRPTG
jgi:hypothetical protein